MLTEKRGKFRKIFSHQRYADTGFVSSTSNICEQFFLKAGLLPDDRRTGTLPANAVEQLFFLVYRSLWDQANFQSAVTKEKSSNSQLFPTI